VATAVLALVIAVLATVTLIRAFANVERRVPAGRPPTGTIVFSRQVAGSHQDFLFTLGSNGVQRRLIHQSMDVFTLSPDGSKVLYADDDPTRTEEILPAVVDLDGSDRRLIRSHFPLYGLWPDAWSPDGTRFVGAGSSPHSGAARDLAIRLYSANVSDGGDLTQVTTEPDGGDDNTIAYSPDGSRILFLRPVHDVPGNNPGAVKALYVVNADGSGQVRLNPSGTVLGPFDSGVAGTPTGEPVRDRRVAAWSPDGTRVAFAAAIASPREARGGDVARGLFVVGADGTGAHRIVPSAQILDAQWSPDGRWIAFSEANPDRPDVFVVHPDGSGLRAVTSSGDGLGSWGPVWAPDSSALLFNRNPGVDPFDSELWFVKVDGSDLTQLTKKPGEYFCYAWSPAARSS
jgi:Tol biopolymer transport system component